VIGLTEAERLFDSPQTDAPEKPRETLGQDITVKIVGILLIIFGVLAVAYQRIGYTKREKVLEIGPLQATTETHHEIPLPPIVGIAFIVGGVVLVATTRRGA
jgi:uncharacterized membrane protein YidH (DUF202 family)